MDQKLQNLAGMRWIRRTNDVYPSCNSKHSSSTESTEMIPNCQTDLRTKQKYLILIHDSFLDKEYSDEELDLEEESSPPKLKEISFPHYDDSFPSRKVQFFRNIHPTDTNAMWYYRTSTIVAAQKKKEEQISSCKREDLGVIESQRKPWLKHSSFRSSNVKHSLDQQLPSLSSNIDELVEFCASSNSLISASVLDPNVPAFIPGSNELMENITTNNTAQSLLDPDIVPKRRPGTRLRKPTVMHEIKPPHVFNINPDNPKSIHVDMSKLLDNIDAQRLNNLSRHSELDEASFMPVPVSIELDSKPKVICSTSSVVPTIPTAMVLPSVVANLELPTNLGQQYVNQPQYEMEIPPKEEQYQNTISTNQLSYQNIPLDQHQYPNAELPVSADQQPYQSVLPMNQHQSGIPPYQSMMSSGAVASNQVPYHNAQLQYQNRTTNPDQYSNNQLPYKETSANQSQYHNERHYQNGMTINQISTSQHDINICGNQQLHQQSLLQLDCQLSPPNIQQYPSGITPNQHQINMTGNHLPNQQSQLQLDGQLSHSNLQQYQSGIATNQISTSQHQMNMTGNHLPNRQSQLQLDSQLSHSNLQQYQSGIANNQISTSQHQINIGGNQLPNQQSQLQLDCQFSPPNLQQYPSGMTTNQMSTNQHQFNISQNHQPNQQLQLQLDCQFSPPNQQQYPSGMSTNQHQFNISQNHQPDQQPQLQFDCQLSPPNLQEYPSGITSNQMSTNQHQINITGNHLPNQQSQLQLECQLSPPNPQQYPRGISTNQMSTNQHQFNISQNHQPDQQPQLQFDCQLSHSNLQQYQNEISTNQISTSQCQVNMSGNHQPNQQSQLPLDCQFSCPPPPVPVPAVSSQNPIPIERYNQQLEVVSHNASKTFQPMVMHNKNPIQTVEKMDAFTSQAPTVTLKQLSEFLGKNSLPQYPLGEHQVRTSEAPKTSSQLETNDDDPLPQYPCYENQMRICQEPAQEGRITSSPLQNVPNNYQMQEQNLLPSFSSTKKHADDTLHRNMLSQMSQATMQKLASNILESLENFRSESFYRPQHKNISSRRVGKKSLPQFLDQRSDDYQIEDICKTSNHILRENNSRFGQDDVFEPENIQNPRFFNQRSDDCRIQGILKNSNHIRSEKSIRFGSDSVLEPEKIQNRKKVAFLTE